MYPRSPWGPLPADFSRFVMFYRSPALTMRRCLRKVQAARASMCTKKGGEVLLKVEQTRLDSQDSKHGRRRWIASRWMFFLMLSGPSAWQIHHLVASRIISSCQLNTCLPSLNYSCANLQTFKIVQIFGYFGSVINIFTILHRKLRTFTKNISLTYMEHCFHDFSRLTSLSPCLSNSLHETNPGVYNSRNCTSIPKIAISKRTHLFPNPKSWLGGIFSSLFIIWEK